MLHNAIVCLNTVQYLRDWEDRLNLAMFSRAIYRLVFQDDQHAPAIHFILTSNQKIQQIQKSTAKSLIVDMGSGEVEARLEDIIQAIPKLRIVTINFVWSSRRIKHLCRFLVDRQAPLILYVSYENYPRYHRQLEGICFVTLSPFLLDYSPYESSSEEEYVRFVVDVDADDVNADDDDDDDKLSSNKRKPARSNELCRSHCEPSEEEVLAEKQAQEKAEEAMRAIMRSLENRIPAPPRQKKELTPGFGKRMKIWYVEHADRGPFRKAVGHALDDGSVANNSTPSQAPSPMKDPSPSPTQTPSPAQDPNSPSSQVSP